MKTKINIEPKIEYRDELHCAAIGAKLKRKEIPELLPPLIPELFGWLEKEDIEPSGPPFFSYSSMKGNVMTEKVGIPVPGDLPADNRVKKETFPAGKYALVNYKGDYKNLYEVHEAFENWAGENGLKFKGPRIEFYPTDPADETNPEMWITLILNQVADK